VKSLNDDSIRVFGAAVLLRHLCALEAEIKGVRRGNDIENVHRMRVASRRFRSAFPLFMHCFQGKKTRTWKEQVRRITSSLGSARDADVQIEHLEEIFSYLPKPAYRSGVRRLLTRLKQQRNQLQMHVLKSLKRFEASGVIADISQTLSPWAALAVQAFPFSRDLYLLSAEAIQQCQRKVWSYEPYIHQPERVEELHAMRVAAKQLRYTLEIFAPLYPDRYKRAITVVKEMQELLGAIHDADVWMDFLPRFIEEERQRTINYYNSARPMSRLLPGIQYLQETHLSERQRLYQEFIQLWDHWTDKGHLWDEIDEIITRPLSIDSEIYPPGETREDFRWTS
jgi:CHAD domain-containing protein